MHNMSYKEILHKSPIAYAYCRIICDAQETPIDYEVIDINPAFEQLVLVTADKIVGRKGMEVFSEILLENLNRLKIYGDIALNGGSREFEQYFKTLNRWYKVNVYSPEKYYFITFFVDISEQKQQLQEKRIQKAVFESEEIFRQLVENIEQVFWLRDDKELIYVSPAYERIWGHKIEDVYSEVNFFIRCIFPEDRKRVLSKITDYDKTFNMEYRIVRPNGEIRWIWERSFFVTDTEGNVVRTVGIAEDITKRKLLEDKLKEMSIRDSLTNTYNRGYINSRLKEVVERYKEEGNIFSLAILDLDHFKNANDTYGHQAGDYILKEFVKILFDNISDLDLIGRYGGEEFILIFMDVPKKKASKIMKKILGIVRHKVFLYEDQQIKITFSAGIVDACEIGKDISRKKLIKEADRKLYDAKKTGRNKIVY